jgi:hypothetical protein
MNVEERFAAALTRPEPDEQLWTIAFDLAANGLTQDEVYELFETVRARLRIEGREAEEDRVMDVMDCICGWCSSDRKIFPN